MTSHPPSSCCLIGIKHEGVATGQILDWGEFEVYVRYPDDGPTEHGILLLTDVFGHRFINSQLIADQFAANGYFVLVPDLFYSDAIPMKNIEDLDFAKWFSGGYSDRGIGHGPATFDPIVDRCLSEMRSKYRCQKIGAAGYCFGAKYVVRHLRAGQGAIDAAYVAHPTQVEKNELEAITGAIAIAAAEDDTQFPPEKRYESEEILKSIGVPYQLNLYSGVSHGFAVRGDPKIRAHLYAKENAFIQAVQWFKEHLKS
ncbi:hypothetical protein H2200_006861 [Cladophialophora chaetospira]|uniref:Dienelactone hydrolase domain-containing protein n=1 Tax=Cladophialophora chaetospira TaxID=386627 RepID=A0AA39CI30_9EURO|nr:hypothetical protein H2200_006861 [Cladophialophora chaetospira]